MPGQEDLPRWFLLGLFVALAIPMFLFYRHLLGSAAAALPLTVVMLFAALLFSAVAAYMAGASDEAVAAEVAKRMERFDLDTSFVDRRLAAEKASFQERFPTLDHEVELRRAYGSGDWYRDQVRQTMEFDQLFFPEHPDSWPMLSVEAIQGGSPQVDLIADYAREFERRLGHRRDRLGARVGVTPQRCIRLF